MARGDKEHNMLFDLRSGRRRNVVKVVYATLAVLMGLSLFLVIGGFNIAELFDSGTGESDAVEVYEDQSERIEAKLAKNPDDPDLLVALTRTKINLGNAGTTQEPSGERTLTPEAVQALLEADQTWSEYLKATDEPSVGLALVVAPTMLTLAELSRSYPEAETRIETAVNAQKIVAEQRPSVNALSTLAFYTYFTGDMKAAENARAEAKKLAGAKSAREEIDKQLDEYKKNAERYLSAKAKAEKEQKSAGAAGAPVENPFGGGLGGGGLGE